MRRVAVVGTSPSRPPCSGLRLTELLGSPSSCSSSEISGTCSRNQETQGKNFPPCCSLSPAGKGLRGSPPLGRLKSSHLTQGPPDPELGLPASQLAEERELRREDG